MNKNKIIKRMISIVLSLLMVVGTLNGAGFLNAKAQEAPEVTLELASANGSWTFNHSTLAEEYQGDSATWTTVRYQLYVYKDGATIPEKIWIEFVGEQAYIWGNLHYLDGLLPSESLYIPKGTVLSECIFNEQENTITPVDNGKTMTLKDGLNIVYNTTTGVWEQKTAVNPVDVSFDLKSAGSAWTFEHSDLTSEYQGTSDPWSGVRYQFTAYVDGATEAGKGMIEFVGEESYVWGATFFPNGTSPTTSFVIPKGTLLRECTVDASDQVSLVADGKLLKVTEEHNFAYNSESGQWEKEATGEPPVNPNPPVVTPPADAPKVTMGFKEVYENSATNKGWILTFNKPEMKGTGFYKISSMQVDGQTAADIRIEMPTWTGAESADWAYIYHNCFPDQKMPESSLVIPEGAMLTSETTGTIYVVEKTLEVTKTAEGWASNETEEPPIDPNPPVIIPPADAPKVILDVREVYDLGSTNKGWILTFDRPEMQWTGFYTISKMIIDGKEATDVKIEMPTWTNQESADWAYIYFNCFPEQKMPEESLIIPKGTMLTNDTDGSIYVVAATLEVKLVNDKWESNHPYVLPNIRNDIRITFDKFDGQGYYLDVQIVAGPDYGKNVADVYGDWVNPSPTGKMTFTRNGKEESMEVLYSPCNKTQLYISGNYKHYVTELTNVLFAKNTVISPNSGEYGQIPMCIVNDVKLEKEPVYGLWGLEGKVETPTEFCDVTIKVKEIKGHALTLVVTLADGSEKLLSEVYGYGASLYGAVTLAEPGIGTYTDNAAVYTIQDGTFKLFGICPAVKDSIEIAAGTVLFEHNACKTSVPIRIVNSVTLTRDAEDDWIYEIGNTLKFTGGVSPTTRDDFYIIPYIVLIACATISITTVVFRKRNREDR